MGRIFDVTEKDIREGSESLSDTDRIILFIADKGPIEFLRIQKLALIYGELANRDMNFDKGFSEDISASLNKLRANGLLMLNNKGYSLAKYGRKTKDYLVNGVLYERNTYQTINKMKRSLSDVPINYLIGLTHCFFPEVSINPAIEKPVKHMNDILRINGKPLYRTACSELKKFLLMGDIISITERKTFSDSDIHG